MENTKSIAQIRNEVNFLEDEIRDKVLAYIKENEGISISMNLETERNYVDIEDGTSILTSIELKIDTNINIIP